ncbi:hypothetical protein GALL_304010 [mine drainage metagenome]|uniref:Uncharacterized protein n=1 Tax=mine drainage metagenome TaxID=410659 RepID=A0A1J5RDK9_9ZZZZ
MVQPDIIVLPGLMGDDGHYIQIVRCSFPSSQGAADESHASAQSPQRGRASLRAVLSEPVLFAYRTAPR